MTNFQGLYSIRDMVDDDFNFVKATFLRGLYHGDSWFSLMPRSLFMENYSPVAEQLIKRNCVKVACLIDEPDVILGYSILSKDLTGVHWVYVRESKQSDGSTWRHKGIASSLVPAHPKYVTHLTTLGRSLLPKFKDVIFNPFKLV